MMRGLRCDERDVGAQPTICERLGHVRRLARLGALLTIFAAAVLAGDAPSASAAGTVQDFDGAGTSYDARQINNPPAPALTPGGPTGQGQFLRMSPALSPTLTPVANTITFDATEVAPHARVVADFDFRMTPGATVAGAAGRADGIGFALLDTATYGTTGFVIPDHPPYAVEEPNFTGSLGVGFDVFRSDHPTLPADQDDIGNDHVAANFTNSVSIHFNGTVIHQQDVSEIADLARGDWIHARIVVEGGSATRPGVVTVILTACGEQAVTVIDDLEVPGLLPYASRAWLGARSGGESADSDVDNVSVQFLDPSESLVSMNSVVFEVAETQPRAEITLARTGNASSTVTAQVTTSDSDATAGNDYAATSTTVTFPPNESTRTITVPLLDDAADEGDESFLARLSSAGSGAIVGGPTQARITIKDDESGARVGQWSTPQCLPVVAIHSSVLPTGEVLLWDRFGRARLWSPGPSSVTVPQQPDGDIFCSGHTFTADGRVLVTGGHASEVGSPAADGVGLATASCYDPLTDMWSRAPNMNAGRWYPTNTTLANGDVLVTSGSVDINYTKNTLPQVWQADGEPCGRWRDLTGADELAPLGSELYPWMFLAPDGKVFKAGPDDASWWLSTAGSGDWSPGPVSSMPLRSYGTAVLYDAGRVLIVGGSGVTAGAAGTPTATAEVIDLAAARPAWEPAGTMAVGRRHLSATVLPDGKVLVTGGTSGDGFNNQTTPVLAGELWDPSTKTWSHAAPMTVPRTYHSTSVLLPDGRVLVAGGGQGAGAARYHNEVEVYSPPYLFKGRRPVITSAPLEITYGTPFAVLTDQAIARVSLIRLPSVTHSFDQNSRSVRLQFESSRDGIAITPPVDGSHAPPGHYMLFVSNAAGVPSVAKIVRLSADAPPPPVPASPVLAPPHEMPPSITEDPPPPPEPVPLFIGRPLPARVTKTGRVTLALKVRCPPPGPNCLVSVLARAPLASGRAVRRSRPTLGRSSYSVKTRSTVAVRFNLTKAGLRRLRRYKRLALAVAITASRAGVQVRRTTRIVLKSPRRRSLRSFALPVRLRLSP